MDSPSVAGRVLTRRQERVLIAVSDGLVGKQVAARLGIGESTVRHEMSAITSKLGARTGSQAVAVAHAIGLLPALAELFKDVPHRSGAGEPGRGGQTASRTNQPTQGDPS